MGRSSERVQRGTLLCFLGGAVLLVVVTLSVAPPAAAAVEGGENTTVYRASNVTFESAEAIEGAITNGTVRPADQVALGDTLVVAIESERLADEMTTVNGSTTVRFFTVLDDDAEFRIIQTNPTPMKNRKLASIGPGNVTVHRNETTVYAVVETGNLTFRYRSVLREAQIHGGERFAVQFGYDLPDDWSRATTPESPIIEFQPRSELTTEQPPTTATPTPTGPETSTSGRSSTREQSSTTGVGEGRTETDGMAGFTVLTTLVGALVLAVGWIRRS